MALHEVLLAVFERVQGKVFFFYKGRPRLWLRLILVGSFLGKRRGAGQASLAFSATGWAQGLHMPPEPPDARTCPASLNEDPTTGDAGSGRPTRAAPDPRWGSPSLHRRESSLGCAHRFEKS